MTKLMVGDNPLLLNSLATALGIDPSAPNLLIEVQNAVLET